jgi:Sulfatase
LRVRSFFEGAGIAILVLASYIWPELSPYHLVFYHDPNPSWTIPAGYAIDLVVACVFFAVLLTLLDYYRPEQSSPLWAALLALLVEETASFAVFLLSFYRVEILWTTAYREVVFFTAAILALLVSYFFPQVLRKSVRAARMGLMIFGCSIFWMLPQLTITAIRVRGPVLQAFSKTVQQPSPTHERVVWILMDELSYDQVYEHRQPDLKLPHFDALRSDSVVFSDLQPEGYYTERIVPALFLGRTLNNVRSSLRKDLEVHDAATSEWRPFNQQATIFGEAKRSGWTTGVAGWYNPYCHILRNVLDSCYWQSNEFVGMPVGMEPTLAGVAAYPFEWQTSRTEAAGSGLATETHTEDFKNLLTASDDLIKDEAIDFVFLHLPVPHPHGIYNRRTNRLDTAGTYLDNLVLTDWTLGNLLTEIEGTTAASRTILIVSSDHSWRVRMWRYNHGWTREEQRATAGRFDPRPFLLIHFPGGNAGEMRGEDFPALGIHDILEAMLKGEIDSQGDLDQWMSRREMAKGQDLVGNRH